MTTFLGRWLAATALLLGTASELRAQAVLRKDLKRDFGAVGDGVTNDQGAFERAAAFFNQRARTPAGAKEPAELRIPPGVYIVGRQDASGKGADVLHLVGCRKLSILGADSATTEVRYAPGLRYGAFDPATGRPYEAPAPYFADWNYAALGGTCLVLQGCDQVRVANLALNGNSSHLLLGGHWGDTGIQLSFDGIFISDSRHIVLRRLSLHHFGRDGIQVLNRLAKSLDDPRREDIVLENSTCDYNGRQGLSLTGVNGFRASNCSFSHTARVQNLGTGHALFSNPAAGVDVEPEGGYVANVAFVGCRFIDNGGQGLVSDRPPGPHPATTRNIRLTDCTLWGTTNWSAWVTQSGFVFQQCRIYGAFVHGCDAASVAEATRFQGCTFEDRPYAGRPAMGPFLVLSYQHARRLSFVNCRFVGTRDYLFHAAPLGPDSAAAFRFRRCVFVLDYARPPQEEAYSNYLAGAVFTGRTVFRDGPPRPHPVRADFRLGGATAAGTTRLQAPGRLDLRARNACYRVHGAFEVGRAPARRHAAARVVVGAGNALVLATAPGDTAALYIGPTARVVVRKDGALELLRYTKVIIAGHLDVEAGAYFFRDSLAAVRTVGRGTLRVASGARRARHPTLGSPND